MCACAFASAARKIPRAFNCACCSSRFPLSSSTGRAFSTLHSGCVTPRCSKARVRSATVSFKWVLSFRSVSFSCSWANKRLRTAAISSLALSISVRSASASATASSARFFWNSSSLNTWFAFCSSTLPCRCAPVKSCCSAAMVSSRARAFSAFAAEMRSM